MHVTSKWRCLTKCILSEHEKAFSYNVASPHISLFINKSQVRENILLFSSTLKEYGTDVSGDAWGTGTTSGTRVFSHSSEAKIYSTAVRNLLLIFHFLQTKVICVHMTTVGEEGMQATIFRLLAPMNIA